MNALDLAQLNLLQNRSLHLEQMAAQAEAQDNQSAIAVPFWGYQNGKAYGKSPEGGLIEIQPSSNSSLEQDQMVMAVLSRGGRAIGRWMPR